MCQALDTHFSFVSDHIQGGLEVQRAGLRDRTDSLGRPWEGQ